MNRSRLCLWIACGLAGPASWVHAQTGSSLLTDRWDAQTRVDLAADLWALDSETQSPAAGDDTSSVIARSRLRARPTTDANAPGLGHEYVHVDFSGGGGDSAVPERLVRQEAAVGLWLSDDSAMRGGWRPGLVLGGGHSSSNPYHDGHGWYALATAFAQTRLDDGAVLMLGVSFDGNRSVLPDTPLPTFEYRRPVRRDPVTGEPAEAELGLTLGYPESRITYRPTRDLTLSAGMDRLDVLTAEVRYDLTDRLSLKVGYGGFYDMFHGDDDDEHRRLFFATQRLEAGTSYELEPGKRFTVTAGYAFDQQIRRGYDARDTDEVVRFDDAPFARVAVELSF